MPRTSRRGAAAVVTAVLVAVVVLAAAVVGGRWAYSAIRGRLVADGCTAGAFDLDTGQAAVASQMVGVVLRRELPERAAVLVLAAGHAGEQAPQPRPGAG